MTRINMTVKRWCETCQKFTKSALDDQGYEICAEHKEAGEDG